MSVSPAGRRTKRRYDHTQRRQSRRRCGRGEPSPDGCSDAGVPVARCGGGSEPGRGPCQSPTQRTAAHGNGTALAWPCTWSRRCCRLRRARTHRGRAPPSRRRARTASSAGARRARTAAAAACDGHATRAPSRSTARRRREAHASGLGAADASLYRRSVFACALRVTVSGSGAPPRDAAPAAGAAQHRAEQRRWAVRASRRGRATRIHARLRGSADRVREHVCDGELPRLLVGVPAAGSRLTDLLARRWALHDGVQWPHEHCTPSCKGEAAQDGCGRPSWRVGCERCAVSALALASRQPDHLPGSLP